VVTSYAAALRKSQDMAPARELAERPE
jgi:hypothetical protein